MIDVRESFAGKLLSALLGTVGLLLLVTFLVVRVQTSRVVQAVTERTVSRAETLFEDLNDRERQQAARLARPFTDSPRALSALLAAIRDGDTQLLGDNVAYEIELAELAPDSVLMAFTDETGRPVLTIVGGRRYETGDPADVGPLAEALLASGAFETSGVRVVDGQMYTVWSQYLEWRRQLLGTIAFGLPITPADVDDIGSIGGFEACFYVDGACVVQTSDIGPELSAALLESARLGEAVRVSAAGIQYEIRSAPLVPGDPSQGLHVVAVPLDEELQPFDDIQRALLFGGGGALFLSALFGAVLSRSLTQPVRDLVAAAGRVAEGDYEVEVEVESRDEIGTLAHAFNDMTRGLLLREQYRSVLDKVVSQDVAEELLKGDVELGGENREVSVLFADIRDFTPMTQGMEPQEVIGLLNECMELLSRAVEAEGGVVDKFIGDEIMAVFGAPVRQGDHAARAVGAAIRMRAGLEALNRERTGRGAEPIGVGIGISSGIAVAGNMGSTDRLNYTVLGETVNLAARLVRQAGPGEVVISEGTRAAADLDDASAPGAGEVSLKGFSAPVSIYRLDPSLT